MTEVNVVLIHGFWSSLATWDSLADALSQDPELAGFRWHRLGYESPKLGLPFFPSRIPDYDDIAQSLKPFLATRAPEGPVVFVTHSQGGLILQRYLTWMLNEGRGRELARIQSIVMLACPHEGTDYLRSIRSAIGLRRNPQAASLVTFNENVAAARRTVLNQVVHADAVSDRECPIPIHVYAGRTDKVVSRVPAQSSFPNASVIPGDHFSIIDPGSPGSLTAQVIKRHLLEDVTTPTSDSAADSPGDARAAITSSGVAAFAADVGCQPGADDRPSRQVSLPSLTASELSMMPLQQAVEALEAMEARRAAVLLLEMDLTEAGRRLAKMRSSLAADAVAAMDERRAGALLEQVHSMEAAEILCRMEPAAAASRVSECRPPKATMMITALPPVNAARIIGLLHVHQAATIMEGAETITAASVFAHCAPELISALLVEMAAVGAEAEIAQGELTLEKFKQNLRKLYEQSPAMSIHEISQRTGYGPSELYFLLSGDVFPRWALVEAFLTAANGDLRAWRRDWETVHGHAVREERTRQALRHTSDVLNLMDPEVARTVRNILWKKYHFRGR